MYFHEMSSFAALTKSLQYSFRGFGGPQGMMIAEQWITHVATYLGKPVEEIMALNFYRTDQVTHVRQDLSDVYIQRLWDELLASSEFA